MTGEEVRRASDGPDAADRPETPGDPSTARDQLADRLDDLAPTLRKTHKRLTKTAPEGTQVAFWEQGIEKLQGHLDEVNDLLEECQGLLADEKKAAEKKAKAPGLGRASPKATPGKLSEALEQFDDAIILAFQKTNAARSSLEEPDQAYSAGSRSSYFVEAAGQLRELAWFCEATAVQLRGPDALVRRASAAEAEDSES